MSIHKAVPAFGSRLNTQPYYDSLNAIIATLRPATTLRTIADHLNSAGFTTPSGKPFTRERVANYLQSTAASAI